MKSTWKTCSATTAAGLLALLGCSLSLSAEAKTGNAKRTPAKPVPTAKNKPVAHKAKKQSITPDQAKNAALAAVPGTAGEVELEDENGVKVYDVDVTANDGKKHDVKVDSLTGKVLKTELDDDEDKKEDGEDEDDD